MSDSSTPGCSLWISDSDTDSSSLDSILEAAITVLHSQTHPDTGPDILPRASAEDAQLRSWTQLFGSTTGPFDSIGGSVVTSRRITAVGLGDWIA